MRKLEQDRSRRFPGGWLRWVVYSGLLALAGTTLVFADETKARYRATAWLQIDRHQPFLAFPQAAESKEDYEQYVASQLEWLKSPIVLDRVLADPEIAKLDFLRGSVTPLETLAGCLTCERVGESDMVALSVEIEGTPEQAAALCNGVVDAYLKIHSDALASLMQDQVDRLDKELDRRLREIERLENSCRALHKLATGRESYGVVTGPNEIELALRRKVEERLFDLELRHAEVTARLAAIEELRGQDLFQVTADQVDEAASTDPRLEELMRRQAELRARRDEAHRRAEYEGLAPAEQEQARNEQTNVAALLQEVERQIEDRRASLTERLVGRAGAAGFAEETFALRVERAANESLRKMLQVRLAEFAETATKHAGHLTDLEFTRDVLARAKESYRRIADRAEMLKTEIRASERVRELRRARPPGNPVAG